MSQDLIKAFMTYAEAFEVGYASRDWKVVDDVLTNDIVWSVTGAEQLMGPPAHGRQDVIRAITYSVDHHDRRFDLRSPHTAGVQPIPRGVYLPWEVTYTREGLPPFVLRGEEWNLFEDGKLRMHYEQLHNGHEMVAFIARHEAQLLPVR